MASFGGLTIADQHLMRARYFRAMALSASAPDVALSHVRLALHYERLARTQVDGGTTDTPADVSLAEHLTHVKARNPT